MSDPHDIAALTEALLESVEAIHGHGGRTEIVWL
jgi:hypothetical protein